MMLAITTQYYAMLLPVIELQLLHTADNIDWPFSIQYHYAIDIATQ